VQLLFPEDAVIAVD